MHRRDNKSQREISRMTGLSRNTVAKWLRGEVDGPPKYRRGVRSNQLTVFHDALKQALKADARRSKRERRTAKALFVEIKAAGVSSVACHLEPAGRAANDRVHDQLVRGNKHPCPATAAQLMSRTG